MSASTLRKTRDDVLKLHKGQGTVSEDASTVYQTLQGRMHPLPPKPDFNLQNIQRTSTLPDIRNMTSSRDVPAVIRRLKKKMQQAEGGQNLDEMSQMLMGNPLPPKTYADAIKELRKHMWEGTQARFVDKHEVTKRLTSGRHQAKDVRQIAMPDELQHSPPLMHLLPGADPQKMVWRGGLPSAAAEEGAIWTTGIPNVGAGYATGNAAARPGSAALLARDLSTIAKEHQGRWTKHLAVDTRHFTPTQIKSTPLYDEASLVGRSPYYEKIITPEAYNAAPVLSRYKPLPDGAFTRTQGDILLGKKAV